MFLILYCGFDRAVLALFVRLRGPLSWLDLASMLR
jgi:hypothetical protein